MAAEIVLRDSWSTRPPGVKALSSEAVPPWPEDHDPDTPQRCLEDITREAREGFGIEPKIEYSSNSDVAYFWGIPPADWFLFVGLAATASAVGGLLKATAPIIQQWLENRGTRSVTIRADGREVTLTGNVSEKQIETAITIIEQLEADENAQSLE